MYEQRNWMPTWNDYFTPPPCEKCGRPLMPKSMHWDGDTQGQPSMPGFESWNRAWGSMYDAWVQTARAGWTALYPMPNEKRRSSKLWHRCRDYERDDCGCRCCIGDADFLIQSRVGEHRIIPLIIENDSRRTRQVDLELSDWNNHRDQTEIKITSQLLPATSFALAACSEQNVMLQVQISSQENMDGAFNDVRGCQVYYADLRVKGCDMRPVRIALALLGRDCEPLLINCHCDCC